VSSYSPVGYIVTKVRAHDADVGGNAQLVYSVTSHGGHDDDVTPPFDVDATNGAVYVTRSLLGGPGGGGSARRDWVLAVMVRDRGKPPLSAAASLVVHVNDSRLFAVAQSLLRSGSGGGIGRPFGFNQQVPAARYQGRIQLFSISALGDAAVTHRRIQPIMLGGGGQASYIWVRVEARMAEARSPKGRERGWCSRGGGNHPPLHREYRGTL